MATRWPSRILLHNLRSTWSINFIFYGCNGMDQGRCPIDFGLDLLSNMAARWLSWILHSFTFRSITWEPLTQLFSYFGGIKVWVWGGPLLILVAIRLPIWPPVAISDFPFLSITSEVLGQSISYFRGVIVWVRGGALSILVTIRLPIWLPGGHLEFCVLLHSAP
jgi:hypothetical protein